MTLRLETIGGGIHAVFYKGGVRIADKDLGNSVEVRNPTPEEAADQPALIADFIVSTDGIHHIKYTGLFMVPGTGSQSGLAAIYGAMPPED